jgi:hypothetical protein
MPMFHGHLRLMEDWTGAVKLACCAASRFAGDERDPPVHDGLVRIGRLSGPEAPSGAPQWIVADLAYCAGLSRSLDWAHKGS